MSIETMDHVIWHHFHKIDVLNFKLCLGKQKNTFIKSVQNLKNYDSNK